MLERGIHKTELLSPAGSFDAARAAVNAGADAIYMGGPLFSARAYAESSKEDMLAEAIRFCRLRGVKVYMTLNILMKEREMQQLESYLAPYAEAGLDAVIVQDPGVFRMVRDCFPKLDIHMSTQATITGWRYARRLCECGAHRIVLPRELCLEEIREIRERTGAELEGFAHGALCYAYSGQCLMSSMIGGRSGNRGRCAGTCRLAYDILDEDRKPLKSGRNKYVLSMRDLQTIGRLREMSEAGVYSLKLEGRMKAPVYVAAVTAIYRKYLDMLSENREDREYGKETEAARDLAELEEVFCRGGFTDGYLDGRKGREMLTWEEKDRFRQRDEELIHRLEEQYLKNDRKVHVRGEAYFRKGELPFLRLEETGGRAEAAVYGDLTVSEARQKPLEAEELRTRLGRLGDTDFIMDDLRIRMDDGIFLPVGSLNALRRKAADELERRLLAGDN